MRRPPTLSRLVAALWTEARFLGRAFWTPLKVCVLVGAGLGLVVFFFGLTKGDHGITATLFALVFWAAFGAWYGLMIGVPAGLGRVLWRTAGPWAFLPLVLVPTCLVLAFWLSSPAIGWSGRSFIGALLAGVEGHEGLLLPYLGGVPLEQTSLHGPGWELGLGILGALFSIEFVWLVLSTPKAIAWLGVLLSTMFLASCVGLVPPSVVSLAMLARGIWTRLRARHSGPD